MNSTDRSSLTRSAVLLLSAGMLSIVAPGCSPEDPETRLKEAAREVEDVRDEVEDARENVASAEEELSSLEEAVNEAQAALAEARKKLRRRQTELARERNELHSTANDTAVFRLVQTRLLEEPSLSRVAIAADVIDGRVTLRGEVEAADQKATAGQIAANTPGVREVVNLIDVVGEQAESIPPGG